MRSRLPLLLSILAGTIVMGLCAGLIPSDDVDRRLLLVLTGPAVGAVAFRACPVMVSQLSAFGPHRE